MLDLEGSMARNGWKDNFNDLEVTGDGFDGSSKSLDEQRGSSGTGQVQGRFLRFIPFQLAAVSTHTFPNNSDTSRLQLQRATLRSKK
jgi:hypothetical protein